MGTTATTTTTTTTTTTPVMTITPIIIQPPIQCSTAMPWPTEPTCLFDPCPPTSPIESIQSLPSFPDTNQPVESTAPSLPCYPTTSIPTVPNLPYTAQPSGLSIPVPNMNPSAQMSPASMGEQYLTLFSGSRSPLPISSPMVIAASSPFGGKL